MATAEKILLGYGVVTVGGVPIGLTRGGSAFTVEREYREIGADGDFGPVKGRMTIDRSVGKLVVNALEPFNAGDMIKYYPALSVTAGASLDTLTGTLAIVAGDYNDVTWTGATKDGKEVVITVKNALNIDNLEWTLEDKAEVVPSLGFTATYLESARTTEPWTVTFAKGTVREVTFTVTALVGGTALSGAEIVFNYARQTTNVSGVSVFSNVAEDTNVEFIVIKGGYQTYFGSVDVNGVEAVSVELTAV